MSNGVTQDQWLKKVAALLRSREGVETDNRNDGRTEFKISHNGASGSVFLSGTARDFRTQKIQYGQLRKTLTDLGILEGQQFVPAKRARNRMSPEILAARAKQQKEFEAWQEIWRTIRAAEMALDVEFEISQMLDYY